MDRHERGDPVTRDVAERRVAAAPRAEAAPVAAPSPAAVPDEPVSKAAVLERGWQWGQSVLTALATGALALYTERRRQKNRVPSRPAENRLK